MSPGTAEPEYFMIVWTEKSAAYINGRVVISSENIEVKRHTGLDVQAGYSSCDSIAVSFSCV